MMALFFMCMIIKWWCQGALLRARSCRAEEADKEMRCDFCGKPAIGYVMYQAAIYCADHQIEAEAIESNIARIEEESAQEREQEHEYANIKST